MNAEQVRELGFYVEQAPNIALALAPASAQDLDNWQLEFGINWTGDHDRRVGLGARVVLLGTAGETVNPLVPPAPGPAAIGYKDVLPGAVHSFRARPKGCHQLGQLTF